MAVGTIAAVVAVRPATVEDVDACLDLFHAVVDEGRWLGAEPPLDRDERRERILAAVTEARSTALVAVDGPAVVGYLAMQVAGYGVAEFLMCVDAGWRGRGVGGALVDTAVAAARDMGAHKVSLQVWPHNRAALRLYERHGFTQEGRLRRHYRRRNGELWDAVVMGLVLDEESPGSTAGEES